MQGPAPPTIKAVHSCRKLPGYRFAAPQSLMKACSAVTVLYVFTFSGFAHLRASAAGDLSMKIKNHKILLFLSCFLLAAVLLTGPATARSAYAASTESAAESEAQTEAEAETDAAAQTEAEAETDAEAQSADSAETSDNDGSAWPEGPDELVSDSAILMEVDTGTIVYDKKMNKKQYPASITKIMTCLLVLENLDLSTKIKFSEEAIYNTEGSGIARDVGEKLEATHCVYAMMLESANECAYALAEAVAGSEEAFVEMMNEKAAELGCTRTHFTNCTGLPDEDHYSTAHDMALIAQAAYQNEQFVEIISTTTWTVPTTNKHDEELTMFNHHAMICANRTSAYLYDYAIGGKTGYTVAAGNTLVTYAQKGKKTYVSVILKSDSTHQYTETRRLMQFGFSQFYNLDVSGDSRLDTEALLSGYSAADGEEILSVTQESTTLTLPKDAALEDTEYEVVYTTDTQGNQTGTVLYTYEGASVGSAAITLETTGSAQTDADTAADGTAEDAGTTAEDGTADDDTSALQTVKNAGKKVSGGLNQISAFLGRADLTKKILGIPIFVYLIILVAVILLLARIAVIRQRRRKHIEERRRLREHEEDALTEDGGRTAQEDEERDL